jgi:hypothetical protein
MGFRFVVGLLALAHIGFISGFLGSRRDVTVGSGLEELGHGLCVTKEVVHSHTPLPPR